jgi:hypothetical protein
MTDEMPDDVPRPRRFQFSLGSMLLLTAVVGLSISLVLVYSKLVHTERALNALQPISAEEVARQFERNTTIGGGRISTNVTDVRYSPAENAYKVDFSWTDSQTGQSWSSDVKLKSDGFGTYFGQIRNSEFVKPLKSSDSYLVVVETPSALKRE